MEETEFTDAPPAALDKRLFWLSFLVLFFELTMIRWTAANIFYVGYFTNFVLLACFLGIGLGCLCGHWKSEAVDAFPFIVAGFVLLITIVPLEVSVQIGGEIHFQDSQVRKAIPMWLILPFVFICVASMFTCLCQPMGRLIKTLPPLRAYTINILGSLAGILGFTATAFLRLPSTAWFAISMILFIWVAGPGKWRLWHIGASVLLVLSTAGDLVGFFYGQLHWSPYYKLRVLAHQTETGPEYEIRVNGLGHQIMKLPNIKAVGKMYHTPYLMLDRSFDDVLYIGAGSGTDVAVALLHGVKHVDAVDIDPVIMDLGKAYHPAKPYQDPRVTMYVNDGRAFLRGTEKKYDMVCFALPDSLTLVSGYSSLRLENYLFTRECLETAKLRLKKDGVVVLYNYYREMWYVQKLARMLREVFDQDPAVYVWPQEDLLPAVIMVGPGLKTLPDSGRVPFDFGNQELTLATDDWPFTYLERPSIPVQYFIMFALLAPFCVAAIRLCRPKTEGHSKFHFHFFFMGAGFFLLEAKSLVQFSLLFGSTWIVNSLVFFAILVAVLLANLIVARFEFRRTWPLAVALFVTVIANFILPLEALLFENVVLRYLVASAIIFSPVFCANLLFSRFFRDTEAADLGFAANLFGAMSGGLLEYSSMILGYRHLMLVVGFLYALALLTAPWKDIRKPS
ncbi:MAG: spermidine synthase [Planctomycetota bacterium]|nr:spermidine synthase [Planctomycetota bacterium]MDA1137170.1 spermidine synthase [Planctomycetota bacterium]